MINQQVKQPGNSKELSLAELEGVVASHGLHISRGTSDCDAFVILYTHILTELDTSRQKPVITNALWAMNQKNGTYGYGGSPSGPKLPPWYKPPPPRG